MKKRSYLKPLSKWQDIVLEKSLLLDGSIGGGKLPGGGNASESGNPPADTRRWTWNEDSWSDD